MQETMVRCCCCEIDLENEAVTVNGVKVISKHHDGTKSCGIQLRVRLGGNLNLKVPVWMDSEGAPAVLAYQHDFLQGHIRNPLQAEWWKNT